ncbi:MAG: molybdate transporter family protein [Burkholderiaceae bacterium]
MKTAHDGATGKPGDAATWLGELSGSLGDLGTFLPYVVAALAAGTLAPAPVFTGFALAYLLVALVYRVPIAVQPMKALGAMIVAGALTTTEIAWAGAVLGALLLACAATPRLGSLARAVPQSVVTGLQAGLGLMLVGVAASLMNHDWWLAAPALAILALSYLWPRGPWALIALAGGVWLAPDLATTLVPSGASDAVRALRAVDPAAIAAGVLGQLPLTLLNAVVVTVAVSHAVFPAARRTVNERRLAATNGLLNLLLAPLGAMPMCHGAGGVSAHHRFGARSVGAPLLLAVLCAAAAFAGPSVIGVLTAIPAPVVGALLLFAALDLILTRRVFDARRDCQPVIAAAALATFVGGALAGLVVGIIAESVRALILRRLRGG